jgi:prephenate dehydratase
MTTYAYLGPQGTFTEAALRQVVDTGSAEHVVQPMASVDAVLAALRAGEVDAAMVPIENSVEGGVAATLDALANGSPLRVLREVLVPITFVLAARSGTRLADVRRVSSHPHAWAQCRGWVAAHLPDARYLPALSTAGAAESLANGDEETGQDAALCAPLAAERFGLEALAEDVGDHSTAVTRFVLVAQPGPLSEPTGNDKTTVVVFQRDDRPGGLLELLEQFSTRGVNLSRIESRPTGDALGQYCFSIDCEGYVREARVAEALMGLHRTCSEVRFLGSYPRADGGTTIVSDATSDEAFASARAWLDQLSRGSSPGRAPGR